MTTYDPTEDLKDLAAKYGGEVVSDARIRGIIAWKIELEPSRNARNIRMTTVTMRYQAREVVAVFPERAGLRFAAEAGDLIRVTPFE